MGAQLLRFDSREREMLVPGLTEWKSAAIDKLRKLHPKIEDRIEEEDEEEDLPDIPPEMPRRDHHNLVVEVEDASGTTDADETNPKKSKRRRVKQSICYAIAVTECPEDNHVMYGAAVLAESIKNVSARRNPASKYDYSLYAFVHDSARECNAPLYSLGYTILNGKAPHSDADKEYIKLYAFSLTNFKVVVSLEVDTIILQPLDELFDLIIDRELAPDLAHRNEVIPESVDFISTKTADKLVDHSFFVARTSYETYRHMAQQIEEGGASRSFDDFLNDAYGENHFELDNCVYNTYFGQDDQCSDTTFDKIQLAHFSSCQAPWECPDYLVNDDPGKHVCRSLHREWHMSRKMVDQDLGNALPDVGLGWASEISLGYCREPKSFVPIKIDIIDPDTVS
jgi:hypothetical protein